MKGVCDSLNIKYSTDVEKLLQTINRLASVNSVQAGKAYLFPSRTADNAVYAVYSHKVVAGDTTGNLCTAYGVKYAEVNAILQGLNPKVNLTAIQKGADILLIAPCGTGAETPLIIK